MDEITNELNTEHQMDIPPTHSMEVSNTVSEIQVKSREDDDDDDEYDEWFQSIRSPTGLEIGIQVTWPNVRPFSLSTVLNASEMAPLFHGTQWAGTRIWSAAVVALQYLLLYQRQQQSGDENADATCRLSQVTTTPIGGKDTLTTTSSSFSGTKTRFEIGPETSVLELGCGLGVPGILLHEIIGCPVVLTDKESLVDQLQTNLNTIFPSSTPDEETDNGEQGESPRRKIEARVLDWSDDGVKDLLDHCFLLSQEESNATNKDHRRASFDIVLNCDCVYEPLYGREAWQSLIACQKALLQANPKTILITSLERRTADGVEHYLDALVEIAQHVERVHLPFVHDPKIQVYQAFGVRKDKE